MCGLSCGAGVMARHIESVLAGFAHSVITALKVIRL
jgi:hypothetical protein